LSALSPTQATTQCTLLPSVSITDRIRTGGPTVQCLQPKVITRAALLRQILGYLMLPTVAVEFNRETQTFPTAGCPQRKKHLSLIMRTLNAVHQHLSRLLTYLSSHFHVCVLRWSRRQSGSLKVASWSANAAALRCQHSNSGRRGRNRVSVRKANGEATRWEGTRTMTLLRSSCHLTPTTALSPSASDVAV
jgi:hypothetical protein